MSEKLLSEFRKRKDRLIGVTSRCIQCIRGDDAKYRNSNRGQRGKSQLARYIKNRAREILRSKKYYETNRERLSSMRSAVRKTTEGREKRRHEGQQTRKKWNAEQIKAHRHRCKVYGALYRKENKDKVCAHVARRNAGKLRATPVWASKKYIALWYKFSKMEEMRTGRKCHVDHIVPLKSPLVCGLHTEDNMQILFESENCRKNNRHWPWMP